MSAVPRKRRKVRALASIAKRHGGGRREAPATSRYVGCAVVAFNRLGDACVWLLQHCAATTTNPTAIIECRLRPNSSAALPCSTWFKVYDLINNLFNSLLIDRWGSTDEKGVRAPSHRLPLFGERRAKSAFRHFSPFSVKLPIRGPIFRSRRGDPSSPGRRTATTNWQSCNRSRSWKMPTTRGRRRAAPCS